MADGNPNADLFDDQVRRRVSLERYSNGQIRKTAKLLDELEGDIRAKIAKAQPTSKRQLEALLRDVREIQAKAYEELNRRLGKDFEGLAGEEARFQHSSLGAAVEGTVNRLTVNAAITAANSRPMQGALLKDWLTDLDKNARARIEKALRISFIEGESLSATLQRLNGVTTLNRRGLEALIRTANTHIAAAVQQASYEANGEIIEELEWRATLDNRTTLVCFPAETSVQALGAAEKLFRRWYEGKMIVVTTARGNELRGTPKHPVLTASGWLPLHELKPGTQVFNANLVEVVGIEGGENVKVPASFGAVSDALDKPPAADVLRKRSAPADFHGDGMGPDHEINIVSPKGNLRLGIESGLPQEVVNALFGTSEIASRLSGESSLVRHLLGGAPISEAPQIASGAVEALVEPAFGAASLEAIEYDAGAASGFEHGNCSSLIGNDELVALSSAEIGTNTGILKQPGDGGCGAPILTAQLRGGCSVRIFADDVVSVRVEDAACHVYNLQTSLGCYIAGGLIVHNCASRDGQRFPLKSGPRPPAHISCRSIMTPVLSKYPPPPRDTYSDWLKRQPESVQDEVLGKAMAAAFRKGEPLTSFVNKVGKTKSIKDLGLEPVKAKAAPKARPKPAQGKTPAELDADARDYVLSNGRRHGVEFLQAIDEAAGEVLDVYRGERSSVGLTAKMEKAIMEPGRKILFHHNHPSSSSLSPADILMTRWPGVSGVWAHGHDGGSYFARVIRGVFEPDDINAARAIARREIQDLVNLRLVDPVAAGRIHLHMVNTVLERGGRIEYRATLSGLPLREFEDFSKHVNFDKVVDQILRDLKWK